MKHEDANPLIDEFLDGELSKADADAVKAHIETCEECRNEARSVRILTKLLSATPRDSLREDERADLVSASVEAAARGDELAERRGLPRIAWIGMAAAIALLVAIALPLAIGGGKSGRNAEPQGSAAVQSSEARGAGTAAASPTLAANAPLPVVISSNKTYKDTGAIDAAYRANQQASSFVGFYKSSDVGAVQQMMLAYINDAAPKGTVRTPAECINTVFRSVPRPLLPAYVERAKYDGVDSWVVVFAFAPDSSPDALLSENLIYVMSTSDCGLVATASYR